MYRPVLVTAPTAEILSLEEIKSHLSEDGDDRDDQINGLLAAATAYLDGWSGILGRCLAQQTWRQDYDYLHQVMRLPLDPVISITSVKYDDINGTEQTIGSSNYVLMTDECGPYVRFINTYTLPVITTNPKAARIAYVAGYASVPQSLKHAMLMLIGHWYATREPIVVGATVASVPWAVEALLAPYRRIRF